MPREKTHDESCWVLGEADDRARTDLGDVLLEFDEDGNLLFSIVVKLLSIYVTTILLGLLLGLYFWPHFF